MKIKTKTKNLIYKMLTEGTGAALCDSGGAYGRHWQRNQLKTLKDFENEPEVCLEFTGGEFDFYSISVFHYLVKQLDTDSICDEFNKANTNPKDWDDDRFNGVSTKGGKILDKYNAEISENGFNTYNGDSALSQVLQGRYVEIGGNYYVVLQIHQGCDVRGGYTDAKLFRLSEWNDGYLAREDVIGIHNGRVFTNDYDGHTLRYENEEGANGGKVDIKEGDKVGIWLAVE